MKIHAQRELEAALAEVDEGESEDEERPRKRRRGGEIGRDWACDWDACEKAFKSVCTTSRLFLSSYL